MDKLAALPLPLPAQDAGFGRPNISTRNAGAGELRQAADALNAANVALANREDEARVNHLAYVASQRAFIVRETVNFKTAELSVANAGAARTSAQLQARTQEADAAQRAAEDRVIESLAGKDARDQTREMFRGKLKRGELDDTMIEIEVADKVIAKERRKSDPQAVE